MKLAIVKPDHLGDLILSSAAIRAILATNSVAALFVAPSNITLARYLFPSADIRPISIPHLAKTGISNVDATDFRSFEQLIIFRNDHIINAEWMRLRSDWYVQPSDTFDAHQTIIDYTVASLFAGPYDIDRHFFEERLGAVQRKALSVPRKIGISIGSGFHANAWPLFRWVELVGRLLDQCDQITILGGAAETQKAHAIYQRLGQPQSLRIEIGGLDLARFLHAVDDLDIVVASDGGTAHLCSLVTPVVSVFGPSPHRRYAPFGRFNRLLTRELLCSPCCQYAAHLINGCLTVECMSMIAAGDVEQAIWMKLHANVEARAFRWDKRPTFIVGASHLDRERLVAEYDEVK